jgi:hypothetical protein
MRGPNLIHVAREHDAAATCVGCAARKLVDLTGIVPVRRAEGDADLPEPGPVQPDRAKRGMVDLTGIEPVTS